jgi:hypothetical protein
MVAVLDSTAVGHNTTWSINAQVPVSSCVAHLESKERKWGRAVGEKK